jgi:hypothetical protein
VLGLMATPHSPLPAGKQTVPVKGEREAVCPSTVRMPSARRLIPHQHRVLLRLSPAATSSGGERRVRGGSGEGEGEGVRRRGSGCGAGEVFVRDSNGAATPHVRTLGSWTETSIPPS